MTQVHGTSVAVAGIAVLLRGKPGSGKSDLALRLIDGGARLVSDDQTRLEREGGRLVASCPGPMAGHLEVRGVGLLRVASVARAPLGLVVDLVDEESVERLPRPEACEYLGVRMPLLRLCPFAASAAAKLRLAVASLGPDVVPPS
jgi:serine kinase of HPr protein (carbohydrate metabolism regulator)